MYPSPSGKCDQENENEDVGVDGTFTGLPFYRKPDSESSLRFKLALGVTNLRFGAMFTLRSSRLLFLGAQLEEIYHTSHEPRVHSACF